MKRFILMVAMLLATLTVTTAQRKVVTDKLQVTELKNAETIGFDAKGNAIAKDFPEVDFTPIQEELSTKLDAGNYTGTASDLLDSISNAGTVKTVNGTAPDEQGNVVLDLPNLTTYASKADTYSRTTIDVKFADLLKSEQVVKLPVRRDIVRYNDKYHVLVPVEDFEDYLFENYNGSSIYVADIEFNRTKCTETIRIIDTISIDSDKFIYTKKPTSSSSGGGGGASAYYIPSSFKIRKVSFMIPVELFRNANTRVGALLSVEESLSQSQQRFSVIEGEIEQLLIQLNELENKVGHSLNNGALFFIDKKNVAGAFWSGSVRAGTIAYDQGDNKLKFYDGTEWKNLF